MGRTNSGEVSLSAATAKTVLQLVAPANQRLIIKRLSIFGKGTGTNDVPVRFRVLRQTTAGTMSAGTVVKNNDSDDETLQATSLINASAEPTAGDVVLFGEVHPQSGYVEVFAYGQELVVKGGGRLGVELLAAAAQTFVAGFSWEE
jgi:hypothetical protein